MIVQWSREKKSSGLLSQGDYTTFPNQGHECDREETPFLGLWVSQVHWWDLENTAEHIQGFGTHYAHLSLKLACFSLFLTQDFEPQMKLEWNRHFVAPCSRRTNHQNWLKAKAQDCLQVLSLSRWTSLYGMFQKDGPNFKTVVVTILQMTEAGGCLYAGRGI